jgi:ribosomal protein S18 acetylase RimI-like enzyme
MAEPVSPIEIRVATADEAAAIAVLLDRFNTEFDVVTPGVDALEANVVRLLDGDEATVLLAGEPRHGLSVLRVRGALWAEGVEAHLQELYVIPEKRGSGIGRALLEATIVKAREAGAAAIDLATGEGDTVARALYESAGFTNLEASPGRPRMLFYEREL